MKKTLKYDGSSLIIETQGGKIEELLLGGTKVLGTFDRIDGKVGSTHICVPNFASEGTDKFGLPFHGPARTLEWVVVRKTENILEIKVTLEALPKYKSALEVRQIFSLHERDYSGSEVHQDYKVSRHSDPPMAEWNQNNITFRHEVSVKNTGAMAVPVNIGIHNYFDTPNGWQNAQLDNKNIKEEIEKNLSVPIDPPVQLAGYANYESVLLDSPRQTRSTRRVTFLSFEWFDLAHHKPRREPSQYERSLAQKSIGVVTQGASKFVTWSGVKDGKYDNKYACIEPVISFDSNYFGSAESLLFPGKIRTMTQLIKLLRY